MSHDYQHLCGWRGIDAVQKTFALQFPTLRSMAPHLLVGGADNVAILLYKAWQEVLGDDPHYPAQEIGDCVSFGHGHALDMMQCIEMGMESGGGGASREYEETDTEFIYGLSRQVAGILGPSDGSYGAAAVKALTSVGVVSRQMVGAEGAYSGTRAKAWGTTGPPANLVAEAKSFKLGAAALVTSWAELTNAIANGYPVTICCDQGFTLERDKQGFVLPAENWGHCMLIAGTRFDRAGACILQSWGPDVPSGPRDLDQPSWSFWIDRVYVERILAEGDSWALSKSPTFSRRGVPQSWSYITAA